MLRLHLEASQYCLFTLDLVQMSQVPAQPLQAETQIFGLVGLVSVFCEIVVKARMARYGLPNMIVSVFWYR
jgi:hypothetical protein